MIHAQSQHIQISELTMPMNFIVVESACVQQAHAITVGKVTKPRSQNRWSSSLKACFYLALLLVAFCKIDGFCKALRPHSEMTWRKVFLSRRAKSLAANRTSSAISKIVRKIFL